MSQPFLHKPALLAWRSLIFKLVLSFCLYFFCAWSVKAQDTLHVRSIDSVNISNNNPLVQIPGNFGDTITPGNLLTPQQKKSRIRAVAILNVTVYSAMLVAFNTAWYAKYPRSSFHFFNDNMEWLQVDKAGHMYGAYTEARICMELWRWSGISRKKRIWYGGLSGVVYQTIIETLDGFSSAWGWSWGDISANVVGSATLISQELCWDDQRIKLKCSSHSRNYGDPQLINRADQVYGKSFSERFLKDYNTLTIWASGDIRSFFPKSGLPPWLAVAIGYGADGMYGARGNTAKDDDGNVVFNRNDIKRYPQFYLAPDIDFVKIKTKNKVLRVLFTALSAFKFPTPSLEFSNGKFKVNAVSF